MQIRFPLPAFILLLLIFYFSCSPKDNSTQDHLGEIHFVVSGNKNAQPYFNKGVLLLHSFEYTDAAETFHQARTMDTNFVMAYWGEAMTYNHPLWQEQDYDKGNEILNELAPTPEERVSIAKTDLEKDFIGGINILYGKGDKVTRDSTYAVYMETLYKKYPGNDEVASFYSLALNGWGTTDDNKSILEKAAKIGYEVLERNPNHPGALHYIIHAYDDPQYAQLALATADKYAMVAPDAAHALHMPTHTYLALGMWDKVVSSNILSWEASKTRKENKKLENDALGYHSYHWLEYGNLQIGNKERARAMVDSMVQFCTTLPSPRARVHLILLKSTYLAETGDYKSDVANISVDQRDLNISTRSKNYFVNGMSAYQASNKTKLDSVIHQLANERVIEELKTSDKGIRMCGNVNRSLATKSDLQDAETMELELRAMSAWLDKNAEATEKYLIKATQIQSEAGYSYGPPAIVKPSYEMYGEWLLETGRPKEALAQFELSLKLAPNKRLSVQGKEEAMKKI